MTQQTTYNLVESRCNAMKIMEMHYNVLEFPKGEPYFTDSQSMDVWELIQEGYTVSEIINEILKW